MCIFNPRHACARVTVLGLCVSVCVSSTTSPATTRNGASNRRYLWLRRNLGNILNTAFSLVQKLWREKANKLISMCLPQHHIYGTDGATFRQKFRRQGLFWFFQSRYKLPGYQAFAFVVVRILSVTCSLTLALSQSHLLMVEVHVRKGSKNLPSLLEGV